MEIFEKIFSNTQEPFNDMNNLKQITNFVVSPDKKRVIIGFGYHLFFYNPENNKIEVITPLEINPELRKIANLPKEEIINRIYEIYPVIPIRWDLPNMLLLEFPGWEWASIYSYDLEKRTRSKLLATASLGGERIIGMINKSTYIYIKFEPGAAKNPLYILNTKTKTKETIESSKEINQSFYNKKNEELFYVVRNDKSGKNIYVYDLKNKTLKKIYNDPKANSDLNNLNFFKNLFYFTERIDIHNAQTKKLESKKNIIFLDLKTGKTYRLENAEQGVFAVN